MDYTVTIYIYIDKRSCDGARRAVTQRRIITSFLANIMLAGPGGTHNVHHSCQALVQWILYSTSVRQWR